MALPSAGETAGIELPEGRVRIVDGLLRVPATSPGFEGTVVDADDAFRLVVPTPAAAARLRELVPALRPRPLGTSGSSFGFGDRLGLATAGHIQALRASGTSLAPVLAQQSARELERTGRTFADVLEAATWGAVGAGWTSPWGADADHLRTGVEVAEAVAAGFTMLTLDPSAHLDTAAAAMDGDELERRVRALPWSALEDDWTALRRRYDRGEVSELELARTVSTFGGALAQVVALWRVVDEASVGPLDVEVSVDETDAPTTTFAHRFLAAELVRLGVRFTSLAPRFPGAWHKGIDVVGDLGELARAAAEHARVAAEGGYRVSVHSGSDKPSVYPLLAAVPGGRWHVKTSGTSYLEALRVVAVVDPALLRDVLGCARESFAADRRSYAVAATAGLPEPSSVPDERLPALLDDADARQCLHVTFGSILTDEDVGPRLRARIREHADAYADALALHFSRHLDPLGRLA